MIIIQLIYNLSILVALSVLTSFIESKLKTDNKLRPILHGFLFGLVAVIGMMNPFILHQGIIFDGRSIVISLCTLFFGPIAGIISSLLAISYRLFLGGGGTTTGILSILISLICGYIYYFFINNKKLDITIGKLYLFGLIVNSFVLILFLTLPSQFVYQTFETITLTILGFYPLITMLIGKIILDQQKLNAYLNKIEYSEKRFKALYNNAPIAYTTLDDKGRIVDINKTGLELLGYDEKELKGIWFGELLHNEFIHYFKKDFSSLIEKHYVKELQYIILKKSGEKIYILLEGQAGKYEFSQDEYYYLAFGDISEIKQVESELIQAKEKAEENDRLKTAFLQNISHEIRTPLNGILGFAALLSNGETNPEDITLFSDMINRSGHRLLNLLNDIIDFSKIESGNYVTKFSYFNLNSLLKEIYNETLPLINNKDIEFNLNITEKDENVNIYSDSHIIHQILFNLINNAVKFTKKGFINLSYETSDSNILFIISDSGCGISPEHSEKIFERFYQVNTSLSRGFEGIGLGLSITKGLLSKLSGTIDFTSEVNKGTTFYVRIPLIKNNNSHKEIVYDECTESNKTIIIAEDDDVSYDLLCTILKKYNYIILRANNGLEVISICKTNPDVRLILLDIKMPLMDGYETAEIIKRDFPHIKIIAQTAYAYKSDKEKALNVGCDYYISKPIDKKELIEQIHHFLS